MGGRLMPYDIIFGSNRHINSSGIIIINGKELLKIEPVSYRNSTRPLITVEIRDKNGTLLGKIYRSTSFVAHHKDYEPIMETDKGQTQRLALKRKSDGKLMFDLKFHSANTVEVNGIFYLEGLGFPIIATPNHLDINGSIISESIFRRNKKDIVINAP